ncbi:MAG: hypothetical protein PHQ36_05760 [Anaerolineales bacterium]|nr:hypothetical protein [Anaerolineales bacterium]
MNFDFGEVLARAWQIIWKHKILWLFGILASCSRGNGGSGGGNSGGGNSGFNGGSAPDLYGYQFARAVQWLQDNAWIIVVLILFLVLVSLIFMAPGFIGRIALIKGASQADKGAEKLSFGELFSESLPYFWRVFGLSFLFGLAMIVTIVPFVLVGVFTAGVGFLCVLPFLCVLIPVAIVVSVVLEQANAAIVLEDLSMVDGFKRGWEVSKSNAGAIVIMALILGGGNFILSLIISIPIIIAVLPIFFGAVSGFAPVAIIGVLCCAVYFPVLIALNGVLTAYIQSAWTLTFMRLTAPKADAPLFIEANA